MFKLPKMVNKKIIEGFDVLYNASTFFLTRIIAPVIRKIYNGICYLFASIVWPGIKFIGLCGKAIYQHVLIPAANAVKVIAKNIYNILAVVATAAMQTLNTFGHWIKEIFQDVILITKNFTISFNDNIITPVFNGIKSLGNELNNIIFLKKLNPR